MDEMVMCPAYGRDYKSKAEVLKDWKDGKDFSINGSGGPYCSTRDFPKGKRLQFRYKKLRETFFHTQE